MILTGKKCWAQIYIKQIFGSTRMHERHYALTTTATNDFINLPKNIFESLLCQSLFWILGMLLWTEQTWSYPYSVHVYQQPAWKVWGVFFSSFFSKGVQQLSKTGIVSDKIVINEKRCRKLSLLLRYLDVFLIK